MTKKRFQIQGMHCVGCAMTIDGALEDMQGIQAATTHYARQVVDVEYDDRKVTDEQILATIQDAGYAAMPLATDKP